MRAKINPGHAQGKTKGQGESQGMKVHLCGSSSSIEVRGTTVWTGYTSGKFGSDDWTLMPRRLLAQYQAVPVSLNERLTAQREERRLPARLPDA